jgi:hypothetical protein
MALLFFEKKQKRTHSNGIWSYHVAHVPKTWFRDLDCSRMCALWRRLTRCGLSIWRRCQRHGFGTWSGGARQPCEALTWSGLSMLRMYQRPGFRTWSGDGHASLAKTANGSVLSLWRRCQRPGFRTWSDARIAKKCWRDLVLSCGAGAKDLVSGPGVEAAIRACCRRGALKLPQPTQREEKHARKRTTFWASFALTCCQSCRLPLPSSDDSRLQLPKPLTPIFSFRLGLAPVWGSPLRIAEQLWRKWYVSACGGFREDSPLSVIEARKRF